MSRRLSPVIVSLVAVCIIAAPAAAGTDPLRSKQWALTQIHADQAWTVTRGAGVTIAIVDTGIDLGHPEFKGKIVGHYDCQGGSCVGGASAGNDDNGHGTHVAGIAAAIQGNGIGIAGVAPAAKLMAVKVLDNNGKGNCSDIVNGIRFASDHGARVINLSLGPTTHVLLDSIFGNSCVTDLQNAAEYAYGRGDVVVIAAGNQDLQSAYDSNALEVVGATGSQDEKARYSNTGADVYAPGGDPSGSTCTTLTECVLSTWTNNAYALDAGTSMAAPHVSGLAALLLARGYNNAQAVARISATADEVDGLRRINVARAVGVSSTSSSPPAPTPTRTRHTTTPTPAATHATTTKPSSAPTKTSSPSASASPRVLAVVPTPSPTVNAAGPPLGATSKDRALPIAIAVTVVGIATGLALRVVASRRA